MTIIDILRMVMAVTFIGLAAGLLSGLILVPRQTNHVFRAIVDKFSLRWSNMTENELALEAGNAGAGALGYLHERFYAGQPTRLADLEIETFRGQIASAVYELRTKANLTQEELADQIGLTVEVINDVEESDLEDGTELEVLCKVASALSHTVKISVVKSAATS